MFDLKRLITIGKQVALVGVALLLFVLSVSSGRTSDVGSRLSGQVLRQAIGLRAQSLRRPTNAQSRASKLEQSDVESHCSSTTDGISTGVARLHAWQLHHPSTYRLIAPHTLHDVDAPLLLVGVDVERARAPPVAV